MANSSSFSTFGGMSAPEIAAMQSGTLGHESRDVTTPVVHTPALRPQRTYQAQPQQPYQHQRPQRRSVQQCPQRPSALCPRQRPPSQHPTVHIRAEFRQRIDRPFPFKRECIQEIFKSLLKRPDFQLPKPTKPDQVGRDADPHYCPYHRFLGHVLEDCVAFKEWLERGLIEGSVVLPTVYLVDPPTSSARFIISPPDSPTNNSDD